VAEHTEVAWIFVLPKENFIIFNFLIRYIKNKLSYLYYSKILILNSFSSRVSLGD